MSAYQIANAFLTEATSKHEAYMNFIGKLLREPEFLADKPRQFIAEIVGCIFTID